MKNLIYILFLLIPLAVFSQDKDNSETPLTRNCSTMEVYDRLRTEDPDYEKRLSDIEDQIQDYIKNHTQSERMIINIPVVVHVVYKTAA